MIKASAPGSTMLAGEHAVLYGQPALVAAIDSYLHVSLVSRDDRRVVIRSDLGDFYGELGELEVRRPWQFVLAILKRYESQLSQGIEIEISSEFSHKVGLSSSAAVTVATLAVVYRHLGKVFDSQVFLEEAISVVREIQGKASGADIAASLFGGVLFYQLNDFSFDRLDVDPPLTLVYAGYKTKTADVVDKVTVFREKNSALFERILLDIGAAAHAAKKALHAGDWALLGQVFNQHHKLLRSLEVSDDCLESLFADLNQLPSVHGAKISGSGLGDCVVAVGDVPEAYFPKDNQQALEGIQQIPIKVAKQGLYYE